MASPEEAIETMVGSMQEKTGHPLEWWFDLLDRSGVDKHGEKVAMLKSEHGLTHGYANMIVTLAGRRASAEVDLVDAQYTGKEALRPIYDAIVSVVQDFGDDVDISPKLAGVSLRRKKQFALVAPTTKTRVDLGLNLKELAPTERLLESKGMCSRNVQLTETGQVDAEVRGWLRAAYDAAG
jgi:hypothetical protein